MLEWGRLGDLIDNIKGLDYSSTLFFVFSQDHIQLLAMELNTGSPNNTEYGQLFLHGVDAKGESLSKLGGNYSPFTQMVKQLDGLPFNRVTLYQEGDFYKSWDIQVKKDKFVLSANTIKDGEDLQVRWGEDLVGLTDESIERLNLEVVDEIIEYVLSEILQ